MAQLDINKLSRLDLTVAATSLVAFISLFLPWYGASVGSFSASVSGWSTSYGWFGGLLIAAAGVLLLVERAGTAVRIQKVGPALLVLGVAALGTLIVIIRWSTLPSGSGSDFVTSFSYGPRVGIYLTVIVGIVQCVAAVRLFRSSGESVPRVSAAGPTAMPPPGPAWPQQGPPASSASEPPAAPAAGEPPPPEAPPSS